MFLLSGCSKAESRELECHVDHSEELVAVKRAVWTDIYIYIIRCIDMVFTHLVGEHRSSL